MRNGFAGGLAVALAIAAGLTMGTEARGRSAYSPQPGQRGAGSTPAAPARLADTDWRLVEFQSMDDATGTIRPKDPSVFTMRLNGDGTVTMRLDCNRATGTWSAEPGPAGSSGRFEFGPLAGTRALCPPPRLDELVTKQAQYVRSFLLRDGRLHLSLMADGGIFVWEPLTERPFETVPDKALEAAILKASPSYTRNVVGTDRARYVYGRVDLDGDGRDEVFVYRLGSIFCGTGGCDLLLFTGDAKTGYTLVNAIQPAFDALLGVVDEVFGIERGDIERARDFVLGDVDVSARDALHRAVMEREGVTRIMSFDAGFDDLPGLTRLGA